MSEMGRFIVIDGGEGSGKGTVIDSLRSVLAPHEVIFTREPGGSPLAEMIRGVIFSEEARSTDMLTNFALFWAARADHMEKTVRPALLSGVSVICDRFDISTYAYQLYGQGSHIYLEHLFWDMREKYCSPDPDLYIYLDVDPEEGLRRVRERKAGNHYDELPLDFHQRVREGYHKFLQRSLGIQDPRRAIRGSKIVDANASEDEVVEEVKKVVLGLIRPKAMDMVR